MRRPISATNTSKRSRPSRRAGSCSLSRQRRRDGEEIAHEQRQRFGDDGHVAVDARDGPVEAHRGAGAKASLTPGIGCGSSIARSASSIRADLPPLRPPGHALELERQGALTDRCYSVFCSSTDAAPEMCGDTIVPRLHAEEDCRRRSRSRRDRQTAAGRSTGAFLLAALAALEFARPWRRCAVMGDRPPRHATRSPFRAADRGLRAGAAPVVRARRRGIGVRIGARGGGAGKRRRKKLRSV